MSNATVKISLTTTHDKQGKPRLVSARPIIQKVKYQYMDGSVCTMTGDKWKVKWLGTSEADYIAVE